MRNPPRSPQRFRTEASSRRTQVVIERYLGKLALQETWDRAPMTTQYRHHDYVLGLRKKVRETKNLIDHRAGPDSDL